MTEVDIESSGVDARATYKTEAHDAVVPDRLQRPLVQVIEGFLRGDDRSFEADLGPWLAAKRQDFAQVSDDDCMLRMSWYIGGVMEQNPELFRPFKKLVLEAAPDAFDACAVAEFDLTDVTIGVSAYHHGNFYQWHRDSSGPDDTRRLGFCFFVHTAPKMFKGGEIEFLDGSVITPEHNRLVFYNPLQPHRVAPVECWTPDIMHGRWTVHGWLHGEPPPEYAALYERVVSVPAGVQ